MSECANVRVSRCMMCNINCGGERERVSRENRDGCGRENRDG